jgi:hypothetical protein
MSNPIREEQKKLFERKRAGLDMAISKLSESYVIPPEVNSRILIAIINNIKDLYELQDFTIDLIHILKDEANRINDVVEDRLKAEGRLKTEVSDLKERFDSTLGSLENTIKKINSEDEQKKKKNEDNPFYG